MTVINSRTRGLAPMMMGNLSDEDSSHHASSDESVRNGKEVFTGSRHDPSKGKGRGKGKIDRECFRCGRIEGPPKSAPKGKSVGNCEDEEIETSQNVPLGTIDWGSFEALADNGDEVDVDESTNETAT